VNTGLELPFVSPVEAVAPETGPAIILLFTAFIVFTAISNFAAIFSVTKIGLLGPAFIAAAFVVAAFVVTAIRPATFALFSFRTLGHVEAPVFNSRPFELRPTVLFQREKG